MLKKKVPPRLWDYGFTWVCETENICANFSKRAHGRTPLEIMPDWVKFNSANDSVYHTQCIISSRTIDVVLDLA
jgi:hypothetical protein